MKRKLAKIIIIGAIFFVGSNAEAAKYHYYVDANSAENVEDGSSQYPWKTIGAATDFIRSHKLKKRKIYVKDGNYEESITLKYNTKLYGESKSGVVIDADDHQNAVEFSSTKSSIKNMTIKNSASTAVMVDKKSKVTIDNCVIEKAGRFGVQVRASSSAKKYKFTIKNSEVKDNDSQGLYIEKRKISIGSNEIYDNDEEGVDLHNGVKGTVSKNNIHGNGESGIEAMLASANLKIKSNRVENNDTQGITFQIYSTAKKGKVKLKSNTIKNNDKYGVRYANYTNSAGPRKFRIFSDKYVKLSKNKISGNGSGDKQYE